MSQNTASKMINRKISVAPMMDWTDRHCRYFHRLLSSEILLYTEMVTSAAIVFGDSERLLDYNECEHPIALQLGGSDPEQLAKACHIVKAFNYDEVNLNVGCPSDRVQSGRFGACLMAEPERVADCVSAMMANSDAEVTVKTRIGIDEFDSYEFLTQFIEKVSDAGCRSFTIHARKAWLQGLSPKQNREVPELNYSRAHQLKKDFPHLEIIINGGIYSIEQVKEQLQWVDGVMIGRAAYQHPMLLTQVDPEFFGHPSPFKGGAETIRAMYPYMESQLALGVKLSSMTRHLLGLFQGCPGAKLFRRYLSENAPKTGAGIEVLELGLSILQQELLREEAML